MNNFSELLAIDPYLHVCIRLHAVAEASPPTVSVFVNGQEELFDTLSGSALILTHIPCDQPFSVEIGMSGKVYQAELETAIVIDSVKIDEHELIPEFNHLASYVNDHDQNVPASYLGWNGRWTLKSDRPFYQWFHEHTGQGWLLQPIL